VNYHNWLLNSGAINQDFRPISPTPFDKYVFDLKDATALRSLFSATTKAGTVTARHVLVALRRFYLAQFRSDLEDKVIDLMVAAEALFLNDMNDELSYRLAVRGSIFLETERASRLEVFNQLKAAYKLRSDIVHGKKVSPDRLYSSTNDINELMRTAIRKALHLIAAGRAAAVPRWDDFAFLDM
jgi:hypothetical protein